METFEAKAVQFHMPNGRKTEVTTQLPLSIKGKYDLMMASGCRLETEMLSTGEVSTTIADAETDLFIRITPNGPEVKQGVIDMLTEFNLANITIEPLER